MQTHSLNSDQLGTFHKVIREVHILFLFISSQEITFARHLDIYEFQKNGFKFVQTAQRQYGMKLTACLVIISQFNFLFQTQRRSNPLYLPLPPAKKKISKINQRTSGAHRPPRTRHGLWSRYVCSYFVQKHKG